MRWSQNFCKKQKTQMHKQKMKTIETSGKKNSCSPEFFNANVPKLQAMWTDLHATTIANNFVPNQQRQS